MRIAAILGCAALLGCAKPTAPTHTDEAQAAIHKCGMDRQMVFKREGAKEFSVQYIAENADSKGFMCVLKELDGRGVRIGFVSAPLKP
jgi:hypothetical protein